MPDSFILIRIIEKNGLSIVNSLQSHVPDNIASGMMCFKDGNVFLENLEPEPPDLVEVNRRSFNTDRSSIWIAWNLKNIPKSLNENFQLFTEFLDWVENLLLIMRFLVNWNCDAEVYYHVELKNHSESVKKYTFYEKINLGALSMSAFHTRFNDPDLIFPITEFLLNHKPLEPFRVILYNHLHAKMSMSGVIDYFYMFAVLEGIINSWAENNGYSNLWAPPLEMEGKQKAKRMKHQKWLQKELRDVTKKILDELKENDCQDDLIKQFSRYRDGTFPQFNDRKIRLSLKQRFEALYDNRLAKGIQNNGNLDNLKRNFFAIKERRNNIAHTNKEMLKTDSFKNHYEILSSAIKDIMKYEIKQIIDNGDIRGKFTKRKTSLENYLCDFNEKEVLSHFFSSQDNSHQEINQNGKITHNECSVNIQNFQLNCTFNDNNMKLSGTVHYNISIDDCESISSKYNTSPSDEDRRITIDDHLDCYIVAKSSCHQYLLRTLHDPNRNRTFFSDDYHITISLFDFETIIEVTNDEIPEGFLDELLNSNGKN